MSTTGKKIKKPDKSKSKIRPNGKDRIEPKDKGDVCIIQDMVLVEEACCCEEEYYCRL